MGHRLCHAQASVRCSPFSPWLRQVVGCHAGKLCAAQCNPAAPEGNRRCTAMKSDKTLARPKPAGRRSTEPRGAIGMTPISRPAFFDISTRLPNRRLHRSPGRRRLCAAPLSPRQPAQSPVIAQSTRRLSAVACRVSPQKRLSNLTVGVSSYRRMSYRHVALSPKIAFATTRHSDTRLPAPNPASSIRHSPFSNS